MKESDKVVTSKGRFGTIISTDGVKAVVQMGNKSHEILTKELQLLSNVIALNVTYIDKYDVTQSHKTEIINVTKGTIIFSTDMFEQTQFIETIKLLLIKRLNNHDLLILKIKIL